MPTQAPTSAEGLTNAQPRQAGTPFHTHRMGGPQPLPKPEEANPKIRAFTYPCSSSYLKGNTIRTWRVP